MDATMFALGDVPIRQEQFHDIPVKEFKDQLVSAHDVEERSLTHQPVVEHSVEGQSVREQVIEPHGPDPLQVDAHPVDAKPVELKQVEFRNPGESEFSWKTGRRSSEPSPDE